MLSQFRFAPLLGLALCGLASGARDSGSFSPPGYAKAEAPLRVAQDATLLDVVFAFEQLAGQTIVLEGNAQEALRARSANPLRELEVSGPMAHTVMEMLLAENQFALTLEGNQGSRWLAITYLQDTQVDAETFRNRAVSLDPDEILRMKEHPALLVTTSVEIPEGDADWVSKVVQRLVSDPKTQATTPSVSGESLMLTGPAKWAAALVAALDPASADASPSSALPGPPIQEPFRIRSGTTILELLRDYSALTNQDFVCTDETYGVLRDRPVHLSGDLAAPTGSVQYVVETILEELNVVLTGYGSSAPSLFAVTALATAPTMEPATTVPGGATFVPVGELARARLQPARLVMTAVSVPGIDVRVLCNAMSATSFGLTERILPMPPNTHRMLLFGFGPQVYSSAEFLRRLSAEVSSGERAQVASHPLPELPRVDRPLEVEPGSTMLELLGQYGELARTRFLFDEENRELLATHRLELLRALIAPPESVHEIFELLLIENGFVLTPHEMKDLRLMRVTSLESRGAIRIKRASTFFDGAIQELEKHPAQLFRTLVPLPGADARVVSNSARFMGGETYLGRSFPIWTEVNAIRLMGLGPRVASMAATLQGVLDAQFRDERFAIDGPRLELPVASSPLEITAEDTLIDVLTDYEELTEAHFLMSARTRSLLDESRTNISESLSIPPSSAQDALEMLLAGGEFMMRVHPVAQPCVATIIALGNSNRYGDGYLLREFAPHVPEERRSELAAHPALIVDSVVHLPGVSVRELVNSLGGMITHDDWGTSPMQQIVPVDSTESVVLTGPGPWVDRLARLLRGFAQREMADGVSFPEFPKVNEPMRLRRKADLLEVVREYERLSGSCTFLNEETIQRLQQASPELPQDLRVPPARVQATFESLLLEGGFVLTVHAAEAPMGLAITPLDQVHERILTQYAGLYVPESQLAELEGHPALFVHTAIDLPGVDVVQLAASPMATKFNELPFRKMMAVGSSSSIVLVGLGSEVHALAESLRQLIPPGR